MREPREIRWTDMSQVQYEITRWAQERFPHRTDHHAIHKLMVEEIPEMAMHKKEHGTSAIGTELADCFILLFDLASLWGVDAAEAIRKKMEINYNRQWQMDDNGIMQHVPTKDDSQAPSVEPFVVGARCPECQSRQVIKAPVCSSFAYRCVVCLHDFNDDCPF